jgi:multidrug resistance efflux pump
MDPLPTIPTPASMYWREFRIRFLPVIAFIGIVGTVVVLWRNAGISSYLAGVAEGVRSTVTSPQVGVLHQLNVQPYQMVQAGDPIAIILPKDPRVEMDLIQSQIQLARLRLQPSVAEQNAMNFESVRVDLLTLKSELEIAKANLALKQSEVRRNEPLFKEKLVSEEIYDLSLKSRDMYLAEIEAKSNAIAQIEARLDALNTLGVPQTASTNDPTQQILTRLDTLQNSAATNWGPIVLRAPISGMVGMVYRQQGESVVVGEPLIAINGNWSDRIVAFVRQPYSVDPMVGMSVHVTTRERKAKQFWSEITQIGAQVETITNTLAFVRTGYLIDVGLPIVIDVPKGMQIRPGETVDVVFRPKPLERTLTPVNQPASGPVPPPPPATKEHVALIME